MLLNESLLFAHVSQGSAHASGALHLCRAEEKLWCERAKAVPSSVRGTASYTGAPGELPRHCHVGQLMF